MLQLEIKPIEYFDESSEEFFYAFPWDPKTRVESDAVFTLKLEHSLLSLSRWEEKWKIPFLLNDPKKTNEQAIDYVRFMTLTKNVPAGLYDNLTNEQVEKISEYIDDPHTATWFSKDDKKGTSGKQRIITAEIIYYWMLAYNIPWDPVEKWHLNRLMTLIRVCSIENTPKKKQSKAEVQDEYRKIKAARRAAKKK